MPSAPIRASGRSSGKSGPGMPTHASRANGTGTTVTGPWPVGRSRQRPLAGLSVAAAQRDLHAARLLQAIEQPLAHRIGDVLEGGDAEQVVLLVRIRLQVVQLLRVPHAVVVDVLVAVTAQREGRRRVREGVLPVVLVEQLAR